MSGATAESQGLGRALQSSGGDVTTLIGPEGRTSAPVGSERETTAPVGPEGRASNQEDYSQALRYQGAAFLGFRISGTHQPSFFLISAF